MTELRLKRLRFNRILIAYPRVRPILATMLCVHVMACSKTKILKALFSEILLIITFILENELVVGLLRQAPWVQNVGSDLARNPGLVGHNSTTKPNKVSAGALNFHHFLTKFRTGTRCACMKEPIIIRICYRLFSWAAVVITLEQWRFAN